ncbi:MAG: hypothetical protein WBG32_16230, partial [Nodosilinea sp.]
MAVPQNSPRPPQSTLLPRPGFFSQPLLLRSVSRRQALLFAAGLGLAGTIAACGSTTPTSKAGAGAATTAAAAPVELTLVSYAVTQA